MRPLLAYLLVRGSDGSWDVGSYRDLEGVLSAWGGVSDPEASAVVHTGFWRPDTGVFEEAAAGRPGLVVLTESARGALPPSFRTSAVPFARAGGLALYEALSGWGYEKDDESRRQAAPEWPGEPAQIPGEDDGNRPRSQSKWLLMAKDMRPSLWDAAAAVGISDDEGYMSRESALAPAERDALALFRFERLAGGNLSEEGLLDRLGYAPPWLLDLNVDALNLSTRPTNRFREHEIQSVGDIARFGEDGLMKFSNMGRRSVAETASKIAAAFSKGSVFCSAHRLESARPRQMHFSGTQHFAWRDAPGRSGPEADSEQGPKTFADAVDEALGMLDERASKILRLRMGLDGASRTLESVGSAFQVTRERIRQIEAKASGRIWRGMTVWEDRMEAGLDRLLSGREEPLPLVGVEVLDPWFRGAADMARPFAFALEHFTENQSHWIVRIDGQDYVSHINGDEWTDTVRKAKALLEGLVKGDKSIPEDEARWLAESMLSGRGEELRPLLWRVATRWANFSTSPSGERLLASFGIGAENVVEAVLLESDRPLHYEEISKLCLARGKNIESRRAHSAAANVGILLAPGSFGLEQHISLSDEERESIISETENMLSENTGKQWHVTEICEGLEERGLDFGGRLSRYVVNHVLHGSRSLVYLGRMVWGAKSAAARCKADRIAVWQAAAAMLQANGGPMRTEEIRAGLSRDRGLGDTFQVVQADPIIRVGEGLWGLLWRDVPFSEAQADTVVAEMERVMRERGRGLHTTEIVGSLGESWALASLARDPVLLVALAQRSGRMKAGKGGYLYPADWEGSRRLCANEAMIAALAETGPDGEPLAVLAARASELMGRDLPTSMAGRVLISAGAVYDDVGMLWSRPKTDEPDPSEEVAPAGYSDFLPPLETSFASGDPAPHGV